MQALRWIGLWGLLALVAGCATGGSPTSGEASPEEEERSASPRVDLNTASWLDERLIEGVFVVPGTDFSDYNALLVPGLDLDEWKPVGRELPLESLNRNDRAFFQQTYSQTLVHTLVMNGPYSLAMEAGPGVLEVRAQLRQGVQPFSEVTESDRDQRRPRGAVMMVLNLELYDARSGGLVATLTDQQPIDRSLNERHSPVTTAQVQRAFLHWMEWFREELEVLRLDR